MEHIRSCPSRSSLVPAPRCWWKSFQVRTGLAFQISGLHPVARSQVGYVLPDIQTHPLPEWPFCSWKTLLIWRVSVKRVIVGKYLLLIASLAVNITIVSAWRVCRLFLWNRFNSQILKWKLILILYEHGFSFLLVAAFLCRSCSYIFSFVYTCPLEPPSALLCVM